MDRVSNEIDTNTNTNTNNDIGLTTIHLKVGQRREIACFDPERITYGELKELFRTAAEAGPLDIVKLGRGDKLLNVSPHLPSNASDDPYTLQIVGSHPESNGIEMLDYDTLRALERRICAIEDEIRNRREVDYFTDHILPVRELKRQFDLFRKKLETTEHLSWLGFYKQLPEPISTEACRRLRYRRKSDAIRRTVRDKYLNICDVTVSSSVRQWLRSPRFDAKQWEDEELLLMLQTMFVELDLLEKFSISLKTLQNFLYEAYVNYNEVPFHNFRHCFCVAQMMYAITWAANLILKIGHLEVFVLIVSCICHDLDHPGYNNIYQINARTELALRYNDISPLENHHCSVAFRVLESSECNILSSLDQLTYRLVREGIIRCILATDMARHNEILGQFTDTIPEFDYSNKSHANLLSMVLIKVADISNEARPMEVAEPWLDRLLQEFFKQSDAEKLEGLPVTPFMDREKVTKPSSQCSFIGLVLLPLFEALGQLIPELQDFIVQPVREALEYYRRLNEAAKDERHHHRKSIVDLGESNTTSISTYVVVKSSSSSSSSSNNTGRLKRYVTSSRSRSIDRDNDNANANENENEVDEEKEKEKEKEKEINERDEKDRSLNDDNEYEVVEEEEEEDISDPETATEVEVSEKTLKFKISTEEHLPGRKSYPGSRKGSRERTSIDYCYNHHDLARLIRDNGKDYENERIDYNATSITGIREESEVVSDLDRINEGNSNSIEIKKKDNRIRIEGSKPSCSSNDTNSSNTSNNQKSLLSRLRNLTDRLSISFETKDSPTMKSIKLPSVIPTDDSNLVRCERCGSRLVNLENATTIDISDEKSFNFRQFNRSIDEERRTTNLTEIHPTVKSTIETFRSFPKRRSFSESIRSDDNITERLSISKPITNVDRKDDSKLSTFNNITSIRNAKVKVKEKERERERDKETKMKLVEIRPSYASMENVSNTSNGKEKDKIDFIENISYSGVEDRHAGGSLDSMLFTRDKAKSETNARIELPTAGTSTREYSIDDSFGRFDDGTSLDARLVLTGINGTVPDDDDDDDDDDDNYDISTTTTTTTRTSRTSSHLRSDQLSIRSRDQSTNPRLRASHCRTRSQSRLRVRTSPQRSEQREPTSWIYSLAASFRPKNKRTNESTNFRNDQTFE